MSKYTDENDFLSPKVTQHSGHMIMTNVNKPSKIKYFNIDTRFQEEYNIVKKANYQYLLPQRITDVMQCVILKSLYLFILSLRIVEIRFSK